MDSTKIFTRIKELGQISSKREELREYCKLKIDQVCLKVVKQISAVNCLLTQLTFQIIKFLPRRILNSDGGKILDCIFCGIPEESTLLTRNKVKVGYR